MDHETLRSAVLTAFPQAPWEFDSTWNGAKCKLPWPNHTIEIWDQSGISDAVDLSISEDVGGGATRTHWAARASYSDLAAPLKLLRAHLQQKLDEANTAGVVLTEILQTFRKLTITGPDGGKVEIDGRVHPQIGVLTSDGEAIESMDWSYLRATGQLPDE